MSPFRVVGICIVLIGVMMLVITPWVAEGLQRALNAGLAGGLLLIGIFLERRSRAVVRKVSSPQKLTTRSRSMSQLALFGGSKAVTRPWPRWPMHDEAEAAGLKRVLNSGKWWLYAYGGGPRPDGTTSADVSEVEQFEREFAAAHFVKHCYAVTSGTNALEIALQACEVGPGDEVITTGYTFIATSSAILSRCALPVYVDIDPDTYNLDPARIEEAITPKTRAIEVVHLGGEICDMDAVLAIARKHNLKVIEDAAQASGSHPARQQGGRRPGRRRDLQLPGLEGRHRRRRRGLRGAGRRARRTPLVVSQLRTLEDRRLVRAPPHRPQPSEWASSRASSFALSSAGSPGNAGPGSATTTPSWPKWPASPGSPRASSGPMPPSGASPCSS